MVSKTYFRHVPRPVFIVLVIMWVLLPVAALAPHLLQPYLPVVAMNTILSYQLNLARAFKWVCALHLLDMPIALVLCLRLGLTASTTAKWMANAAFSGFFALRMLIFPSEDRSKKAA